MNHSAATHTPRHTGGFAGLLSAFGREKKGVVSKINAAAGDSLAVDEVIMEFE